MFKDNSDVAFCDVNLSDDQVRESHGEPQNPGSGGWPTVRHFNKETGYGGKAYVQKTSGAMCDELGDVPTMQAMVEEAGGTSLCSAETEKGCGDKEKTYIGKWKGKAPADVKKEATRLKGMDTGAMKPEAAKWLKQRGAVLKQLSKDKDEL